MQPTGRVEFTKEMKRSYKILAPDMLPIHFSFIKKIFNDYGYNMEILKNVGKSVVDCGLKYVHNDTCYPALLVIGQFIDALESGKYDTNRVALMITQTGGGCRASNYIHLLRKALQKAGFGHVPVISLNLSGLEKNSGFKFTLAMLRKTLAGIIYGDLLMLLKNQTEPYECEEAASQKAVDYWIDNLTTQFHNKKGLSLTDVKRNLLDIAEHFSKIKAVRTPKTKVGIVGEIYVKYAEIANNSLEKFLLSQGCEVMVPGLMGFMLFKLDNRIEDIDLYGGSFIKRSILKRVMQYFLDLEKAINDSVKAFPIFSPPGEYFHLKHLVDGVVGHGNKMGEGWLLTAEMLELCEQGYSNIVCAQPFGCLPNHIVGKGMIRKIRSIFPSSNIVSVDYDPGATKVNQENRIKLMLAVAREGQ